MADLNRPGGPSPDLFDMSGVIRPRTGPAGVTRGGGVQGIAPDAGMLRPPTGPATNTGFPGRPPAPPAPASPFRPPSQGAPRGPMGGESPGVPVQTPAPAPQPPGVVINIPTGPMGGGTGQDQGPVAGGGGVAKQPQQPATPGTAPQGTPNRMMMNRMPRLRDMQNLLPGTQVETPYGPVVAKPDGSYSVQLTPEGKVLYGQEQAAMKSRFGAHPFAADPGAPQPNLIPGQKFFNPFTGRYGD